MFALPGKRAGKMRINRQLRSLARVGRDRYEAILNATTEGIYGLDPDGCVTFVNAVAETLIGWTRQEQIGKHQHDLIHHSYPDGTPYPVAECPIYHTLRTGQPHSGEEAYLCKDGSFLPVTYTCVPLLGEKGEVTGAVITFSDRSVQLAERRYRALIEATSDYVWRCDPEGAVIEVDPQWLQSSGLSEADVLGWAWLDLHDPEEREKYLQHRSKGIESGKPFSSEYRLRGQDGEFDWYEERLVPVVDPDGVIVEWVGIGRDITERKSKEDELAAQALRDPLTKAFNRRQLHVAIQEEIARSLSSEESFSLLLVDADHFKAINDQHGHESGDQVLKQLVDVLSGGIRRTDTLARWGGEEFTILLPGARRANALRVAESLRARVNEAKFNVHQPVTVSIGLAEYKKDETAEALIRRADQALYKAKESGRNCVVAES